MHALRSIVFCYLALLHPVVIAVAIGAQEPLQPVKEYSDTPIFHKVRPKLPGDIPFHFIGDPRINVLQIEKLDLIPNPPDK